MSVQMMEKKPKEIERRRRTMRLLGLLIALAGSTIGCESEALGPLAGERDLAPAGPFSTANWSTAVSIETAPPGAHANFNTPTTPEGCPFISRDGKSFYIASVRPDDPAALGGLDIYVSTRSSVGDQWGEPVNVGAPVNSTADDFCPTIDRNGHDFYFVSSRQEGVQGVDWCGGGDIYATRLRNGVFAEPRNLGCAVNSAGVEFSPFPINERGSGPVLYFSSTRPGLGVGGDLYRSESHGGVFGPAELVPGVNSPVDDGQPNVRRDGLELFFYSFRANADQGTGNDIYVATRSSTKKPWSTPVNLGPDVNGTGPSSETRPSLSWDGSTLYFGTSRDGSGDIYVTNRSN